MKKHSFIFNLLIISGTSVVLNIIALIFRFYLAKLISTEGMGIYQLIMSVYVFFATAASSGLSFTTTRFVSEAIATKRENSVKTIMTGIFLFALIPALTSSVCLFFISETAASSFIGIPETARCLKILAAALPFMAAASCMNGYFVALRKVAYSSATQIFEDLFQVIVTVILLLSLSPKTVTEACELAVAGCTAAEISAAAVAGIFCKRTNEMNMKGEKFRMGTVTVIAKTTLPLSVSACIKSVMATAEDLLIPVSLQKSGLTRPQSLSVIGTVKGLAVPLICFPSVLVTAFARLLLPEIADSRALSDKKRIVDSGNAVLSFTTAFSLLLSVVFFLFSDDIGLLIYNDPEFFKTLKILSLLIPFMYVDCISDSILKGMDQQLKVMQYSIAEAAVRLCIVWFLIPKTGFSGVIAAIYAGNVLNAVLGILKLKKIGVTTLKFLKKSFLAILLYLIILAPVSVLFAKTNLHIVLKLFLIVSGFCLCSLSAFSFNIITPEERKNMAGLMKKR